MDKENYKKASDQGVGTGSPSLDSPGTSPMTTLAMTRGGINIASLSRTSQENRAPETSKTGKLPGVKLVSSHRRTFSDDSNSYRSRDGTVQVFECDTCNRQYTSKSNLVRHQRTCEESKRRKCRYCVETFNSFASVRIHERRAHAHEFNEELAKKLPPTETELMATMAEIEAKSKVSGVFIKSMMTATGLTKDQIRHRRAKPNYQDHLSRAREKLASTSRKLFASGTLPTSSTSTQGELAQAAPSVTAPTVVILSDVRLPVFKDVLTTAEDAAKVLAKEKDERNPSFESPQQREAFTNEYGGTRKRSRSSPPSMAGSKKTSISVKRTSNLDKIKPMASTLTTRTISACAPTTSTGAIPRKRPPTSMSPQYQQPFKKTADRKQSATPPMYGSTSGTISTAAPTTSTGAIPCRQQMATPPMCNHPIYAYLTNLNVTPPDVPLQELIRRCLPASPDETASIVEAWISSNLTPAGTRRSGRGRRNRIQNYNREQRPPSRGVKASLYKKTQDLYSKNKKMLTDFILSGKSMNEDDIYPELKDVEELFGNLLESPSPADDHPITSFKTTRDTSYPITPEEVARATNGWRPSAPGPDGVTVQACKNMKTVTLAVVFNILLLKGCLPPSWRLSRTVLIPKEGDRKNANNWRPITISNALQRLFHRLLVSRLNVAIQSNSNQRGFRDIDGTLANTLILESYMKNSSERRRGYNIISLDLRKAFDSVSHQSIYRALNRHGVDPVTTEYIRQSLSGTRTTIAVGRLSSRPITIQRGVKQGDPLSPLLFNMVLDELLDSLDSSGRGATIQDGIRCTAMAFADDLILMDDKEEKLTFSLSDAEIFFERRGMAINPTKSSAVSSIFTRGNMVFRTKPIFRASGRAIPMVGHLNTMKYLGHRFSTTGCLKPTMGALPVWLSRLSAASLKPSQKYILLRDFVIPRLMYGFQSPKITGKILRDADSLIKNHAKRMLHLHKHTPDPYIHASIRDGGLGLPNLRWTIPFIFLGRINRLRHNSDEQTKTLMGNTYIDSLSDRLRRLAPDGTPAAFWREEVCVSTFARGLEASIEDASSRHWLYQQPPGWSGRDFVRAIQLRTDNLPTAGIMSNRPDQRRCRGCQQCNETLCHVLQSCRVTHWPRIHRHNEIARKISRHCKKKKWNVENEPHVRHPDGQLYKPDLAVHKTDGQLVITDVQISWEAPRPLAQSWENKRLVYDNIHFREAARKKWPGKELVFAPVIIGARGIWPRANALTAQLLQLPGYLKKSCVNSCVQWGSTIHRDFMAAVWKRQHPASRTRLYEPP